MFPRMDSDFKKKYVNLLHIGDTPQSTALNSPRHIESKTAKNNDLLNKIMHIRNSQSRNLLINTNEELLQPMQIPGISMDNSKTEPDLLINKDSTSRVLISNRSPKTPGVHKTLFESGKINHQRGFSFQPYVKTESDFDMQSSTTRGIDPELKSLFYVSNRPSESQNIYQSLPMLKTLNNFREKDSVLPKKQGNNNTNNSTSMTGSIYFDIKGMSDELINILERKYDSLLKSFMDSGSVEGFCQTQRDRLFNLVKVFEKSVDYEKSLQMHQSSMPSTTRTSIVLPNKSNNIPNNTLTNFGDQNLIKGNLKKDIILLLRNELISISESYEKFIQIIDNALKTATKTRDKVHHFEYDYIDGLNLLIEYGNVLLDISSRKPEDINSYTEVINQMESSLFKFKLNYKTKKDHSLKLYECFENLENMVKAFNLALKNESEKAYVLTIEKEKLTKLNNDVLCKNLEKYDEFKKLIQSKVSSININQQYDSGYSKEKKFEILNQDIYIEYDKLRLENEKLNSKINSQKDELEIFKKSTAETKKIMVDNYTEMQVNFDEKNPTKKPKISQIFFNVKTTGFNGVIQSEEWVLNIINMIYSDKIITDIQDDLEHNPRTTLNEYISEWFLKRYGLYKVIENLLRDFSSSIQSYYHRSERYKIFCDLCGFEINDENDENSKKKIFEGSILKKNKLKKEYLQSNDCLSIYLKLIYYLKTSSIVYTVHATHGHVYQLISKSFSTNMPGGGHPTSTNPTPGFTQLLPLLGTPNELINIELCKLVMSVIFTDEGISYKEHEETLKDLAQNDLYLRMVEQKSIANNALKANAQGKKSNGTEQDDQNGYLYEILDNDKHIRIDFFARYVLDIVVEHKIRQIEQIHTALKMYKNPESPGNSISYEEFTGAISRMLPNKSMDWISHAYYDIMNAIIAEKMYLSDVLSSLMPRLFNLRSARDFYVRAKLANVTEFQLNDMHNNSNNNLMNNSLSNGKMNSNKSPTNGSKVSNSNNDSLSLASSSSLRANLVKYSLVMTFKEKIINHHIKPGLHIGNTMLKNIAYQVYDCASSLMILINTYESLKPRIDKVSKINENLATLSDEFNEDLAKLPDDVIKSKKFSLLNVYSPLELVNYLEGCWKKLRYIIVLCFRK